MNSRFPGDPDIRLDPDSCLQFCGNAIFILNPNRFQHFNKLKTNKNSITISLFFINSFFVFDIERAASLTAIFFFIHTLGNLSEYINCSFHWQKIEFFVWTFIPHEHKTNTILFYVLKKTCNLDRKRKTLCHRRHLLF